MNRKSTSKLYFEKLEEVVEKSNSIFASLKILEFSEERGEVRKLKKLKNWASFLLLQSIYRFNLLELYHLYSKYWNGIHGIQFHLLFSFLIFHKKESISITDLIGLVLIFCFLKPRYASLLIILSFLFKF